MFWKNKKKSKEQIEYDFRLVENIIYIRDGKGKRFDLYVYPNQIIDIYRKFPEKIKGFDINNTDWINFWVANCNTREEAKKLKEIFLQNIKYKKIINEII